jgi:hypothetical protein
VNRYALTTLGVVAAYIVIALSAKIVFFGILPVGLSIRSQRAKEPLAPVAIAAAVISVIAAFALLSRH